jgi:phage terminase Nu1 subunit (DNA packaging protein)
MSKTVNISASVLARHLDCSRQWIARLVKEGVLAKRKDGSFDLDACRVKYIRHLRDADQRGSKSDAVARAQEARARSLELRNAKEEGRLIEFNDVEDVIGDIVAALSSELAGVPAGSTRDLGLREVIEGRMNDAINRCRSRFEAASKALRAGRDPFADNAEDDAA